MYCKNCYRRKMNVMTQSYASSSPSWLTTGTPSNFFSLGSRESALSLQSPSVLCFSSSGLPMYIHIHRKRHKHLYIYIYLHKKYTVPMCMYIHVYTYYIVYAYMTHACQYSHKLRILHTCIIELNIHVLYVWYCWA